MDNYGQQYQQPQPQYQQPQASYSNNDVSVKEWIITWLIMCIPFVNFIMIFVWAFGSNTKPSKSNLFKAYLLLIVIVIALWILLAVLFGASFLAGLGSLAGGF